MTNKKHSKMVELSPTVSVGILNINGLKIAW